MRNIERHTHDDTRDKTSTRHSQHPTNEDLTKLPPINTLQIPIGDCNTNDRASDALCGADGQTKTGGKEDGDGGCELHAVAAGRAVLGDAVSEVAHDVVAVLRLVDYWRRVMRFD